MIARIENGAVVEYRNDITIADVPDHKRSNWLPVFDTRQPCDGRVQIETGPVVTVNPGVDVQRVWSVVDRDLSTVKDELAGEVDRIAEEIRLKYITPGSGMVLVYDEKRRQADLVIAGGKAATDALTLNEAVAAYPVLAASIGIEAASLWDCAQVVRSKYQDWAMLAHVIEKARLAGKAAILAASTPGDAVAAYDAIVWGA